MIDAHKKALKDLRDLVSDFTPCAPTLEPMQATRPPLPPPVVRSILDAAVGTIECLSAPRDFEGFQYAELELKLARAEANGASIKVERQHMRTRCAELLSQAEPLNGLGADRELVRKVLHYVQTGRLE